MNTSNFSTQFDVLVNAMYMNSPIYGSETPLSFNEYEKSVFLTKAQKDLILELYSLGSFERTEEITRYLDILVEQATLTAVDDTDFKLGSNSYLFKIPDNLWFITYEQATIKDDSLSCNGNTERIVDVVPVTQDHFYRTSESPFRSSNSRRVLRLSIQDYIELSSIYPIENYLIRYMRVPSPIILAKLPDGLDIDGKTEVTECELNTAIHKQILDRAVQYALSTRGIQFNNTNTKN